MKNLLTVKQLELFYKRAREREKKFFQNLEYTIAIAVYHAVATGFNSSQQNLTAFNNYLRRIFNKTSQKVTQPSKEKTIKFFQGLNIPIKKKNENV